MFCMKQNMEAIHIGKYEPYLERKLSGCNVAHHKKASGFTILGRNDEKYLSYVFQDGYNANSNMQWRYDNAIKTHR